MNILLFLPPAVNYFDKPGFRCYYSIMLRGLLKGLTDLIYPNCCLACKNRIKPDAKQNFICAPCRDKIEINLPPFCASCGRRLAKDNLAKNICSGCLKTRFHFDRAFSPCKYNGTIKKLIHEFKYAGRDYLGESLGSIMNSFIKEYALPIEYVDFIIPMPLHNSRLREREFNQAQILSEKVGKEFNKEVLPGVLVRDKATRAQVELNPEERLLNVKNSFRVTRPALVKNMNLLLIDDVLTTGATSSEAARSLKESGAGIVFVMTLAN